MSSGGVERAKFARVDPLLASLSCPVCFEVSFFCPDIPHVDMCCTEPALLQRRRTRIALKGPMREIYLHGEASPVQRRCSCASCLFKILSVPFDRVNKGSSFEAAYH